MLFVSDSRDFTLALVHLNENVNTFTPNNTSTFLIIINKNTGAENVSCLHLYYKTRNKKVHLQRNCVYFVFKSDKLNIRRSSGNDDRFLDKTLNVR